MVALMVMIYERTKKFTLSASATSFNFQYADT